MRELKIKIDYTAHKIQWDDITILMKQRGTSSDLEMTQMIQLYQKKDI